MLNQPGAERFQMKLVHSSKTKRAPRRWYGEEAELLTDAEQAAHNARMAQMEAGTYDWSGTLQPAPTSKPRAEVI